MYVCLIQLDHSRKITGLGKDKYCREHHYFWDEHFNRLSAVLVTKQLLYMNHLCWLPNNCFSLKLVSFNHQLVEILKQGLVLFCCRTLKLFLARKSKVYSKGILHAPQEKWLIENMISTIWTGMLYSLKRAIAMSLVLNSPYTLCSTLHQPHPLPDQSKVQFPIAGTFSHN